MALKAGHRYFLEARMQQSTGADNLAVRWMLPNGAIEEPLVGAGTTGTWVVPCRGIEAPPGLYLQPTNLVVSDGLPATFTLLVTNSAPVAYQWRCGGTNLPGSEALAPVYRIERANPVLHNQQSFTCVISNATGVVTSAPAVLTVIADLTRPAVLRSAYLSPTNVQLVFSEPLEPATATNQANYVFTNAVPVLAATLTSGQVVTLTTGPMVERETYALRLNAILD